MSLLEARELAFSYGDKPIFADVGFSVGKGQVFCLVGPNGCGKTTLVHCILAHLKPTSGSILIDGADVAGLSPRERAAKIAYVPQTHVRSFPYRTVDVVAMGRTRQQRFLGSDTGAIESALRTMARLNIDHLAETEYTALSGGELQMVLVARALAQESEILVLDEPAAHLDVKRMQDILLMLAELARDHGTTIVLSTHDFNHPLMLQDEGADVRMALMNDGRFSATGTPLDMLSSDLLGSVYGVQSRIVELQTTPPRHFLAVWSDVYERPGDGSNA